MRDRWLIGWLLVGLGLLACGPAGDDAPDAALAAADADPAIMTAPPPARNAGPVSPSGGQAARGASSRPAAAAPVPSPPPTTDPAPDPPAAAGPAPASPPPAAGEPGVDGPPAGSSEPPGSPDPDPGDRPLPGTGVTVFPPPGAQHACPDPVLRLRFPEPPRLGEHGRVEIVALADNAGPERVVAGLDMAQTRVSVTAGGRALSSGRTAWVVDREAHFQIPGARLSPGQTYAVTIDPEVLAAPALTVSDTTAWRFTVAGSPPTAGALRVAYDGTGDYCTLRGALDAIPDGSTTATTVTLAPGVHHGPALVENKHRITVRGEGRERTRIVGENNEGLNPGTAARALFAWDRSSEIVVEQLTIHNTTPQGGGQAEALRMQRCEQCQVRDVAALSLQDTLLLSGSVYVGNSYIEGNVDYLWGTGAAFFERCELKTVGRGGYLVQARNNADGFGFVFVDCTLSRGPGVGVGDTVLARIEVDRFPASQVAFIDCTMDAHIAPEGWRVTGDGSDNQLRFQEYGSRSLDGTPIDIDARHPSSHQLTPDQADRLRDPSQILSGFHP